MANKNDCYYMLNGDEIESSAVYIPYQGTYVKNTRDISDYDLASIDLGTDFREAIQEANPKIKLGNQYYLGKYPYAKGIKIFKPVEVFTDSTQPVVDSFREISEERNYLYHQGHPLDSGNKDRMLRLVNSILSSLSSSQKMAMFNKSSLLGKDTKGNYYHNKYLFDQQITNYTQLRNMVINYLFLKAGKSLPSNYKIQVVADSLKQMQGLYPEEPDTIKKALEDYRAAILKAKDEEERKAAFEEYSQLTQEPHQMTLYDICPQEELSFLNKSKN